LFADYARVTQPLLAHSATIIALPSSVAVKNPLHLAA
jgi:hypothetical protein